MKEPVKEKLPQIMTRLVRNGRGEYAAYYSIDFVPGAVIERCGRRYQVEPNGSQKRIRTDAS